MWSHHEMNSIFYVDSDYESLSFNNSKMETEVRSLKQELSRTREALKLATKRCRDLVRELDSRTVGHDTERCLRDQQLSRILRALLVLESRLKQEQKSIRQLLCEKDTVIRDQQLEIARLRRYTKNYIKCEREQNRNSQQSEDVELSSLSSSNLEEPVGSDKPSRNNRESRANGNVDVDEMSNELGNDIRRLKREIIDKLSAKAFDQNDQDSTRDNDDDVRRDAHRKTSVCAVRKTNSFAGSDVSKESCASSSENTDAGSILTTTTDESSPSLLSTEGFCEGESTDCSPGSTLNKSSTKSFANCAQLIDPDIDTRLLVGTAKTIQDSIAIDDLRDRSNEAEDAADRRSKVEDEGMEFFFDDQRETKATITRTESKDDGMDCNYASEDENLEDIREPIYANACNENNARNLRESRNKIDGIAIGKNEKQRHLDNNNRPPKLEHEETSPEETSGNWYSDPDEDRVSDDVFRHTTYRPNGNHNPVLECVNQILLRDMEEEESVLTAPRRFKHRGRIVRFQPARLSDIESVGSEMERRNSDDCVNDRDAANDSEMGNFEATASEDEFGMRIEKSSEERPEMERARAKSDSDEEKSEAAIPIVVIEPKSGDVEATREAPTACLEIVSLPKARAINRSGSPTSRMERIEEKTCLQMSSRGLTIAKNLDYEDIESLPEIIIPSPKTPPALPPKPTQFRNTLVLKKIPSPSFLIDETRRKNPQRKLDMEARHGIASCLVTPNKTAANNQPARSLVFEDKYSIPKVSDTNSNDSHERNKSTSGKSSAQITKDSARSASLDNFTPRVTSMVRHFEEFKIGTENERTLSRDHERCKDERARGNLDFDNFDIRQNFEEFNLDDCDLSDDPDRPEADGSDRLANVAVGRAANDKSNAENNNLIYTSACLPNVANDTGNGFYDHFLEATGLSNKSILTPSRLLSNHKSMLKPKDVKYKNKIKSSNAVMEKNHPQTGSSHLTQVRHWTGPFV